MQQEALANYWMPFTANRQFKTNPKLFTSAEGMFYTTVDGKQVLDATAGLWCVNAGHNQSKITQAIQTQAETLDYAPGFQLGHPKAFEFASKLAQLAPENLNRVFFTNSGSESADTALKIALAYYKALGQEHRTHLVGRNRGYHGVGFGGISVGGIDNNKKQFKLLPEVSHLKDTHNLEHNAFSPGMPSWGAHLADELTEIIAKHDNIAAVMVEPVAGSTGVLVPPISYLQRLRDICNQHNILLIFDEVITAFGRIDGAFACNYFDVIPDIITTAKGLTNGAVPMGAVLVRDSIYDAIMDNAPEKSIELFHGYTYSGHPLACSAGLACLEVYEEQKLFHKSRLIWDYWQEAAHQLKSLNHVVDIRNIGLIAAIELRSKTNQIGQRAMEVFNKAFEKGLLIRVTGDVIALSPPLIIEKEQIDFIFSLLEEIIRDLK